ncbi:hypothetical protein [Sulfolobus sp. B1]|nr:hypothetical protein [Sulfolobus sp. B1]
MERGQLREKTTVLPTLDLAKPSTSISWILMNAITSLYPFNDAINLAIYG